MRKECLDRSLGCADTLTAYGRILCLSSDRASCALTQMHFKHLQCLNFDFVYLISWESLSSRCPMERPRHPREIREPKVQMILMLSALRVAPDVHQGALPIPNPAHSQYQQHFGEPT